MTSEYPKEYGQQVVTVVSQSSSSPEPQITIPPSLPSQPHTSQSNNSSSTENAQHRHICDRCGSDFDCEGECCGGQSAKYCEGCEQAELRKLAAACPTASTEQIRRYQWYVRDSVSIGVCPLSFGMWMALREVEWLRR